MRRRTWLYALVVAAVMAATALVTAHVFGYFGSKVVLLVTNGMWVVGLVGVLVSLVAMMILGFRRRRRPRA